MEDSDSDSAYFRAALLRVQQELDTTKEELAQADNEIEDLEKELFEAQQGADRTPGALLFFAALQDEGAVPTMQQLVLQLGHLKSFVDGSEHLDFPTMRKRLQVCVECVPNLSKFISKYSGMVQKWSQDRYKAYTSRNLTGGDADAAMLCPLCSADFRSSGFSKSFGHHAVAASASVPNTAGSKGRRVTLRSSFSYRTPSSSIRSAGSLDGGSQSAIDLISISGSSGVISYASEGTALLPQLTRRKTRTRGRLL